MIKVELISSNGTIPEVIDGVEQDVEVVVFSVVIDKAEIQTIDAVYDPASSSSPPAAENRPIVRAIMDAWRAQGNG